jgi:hypothetical protein
LATSRTTQGFKYVEGPLVIREYPADETHGSFLAGDIVEMSAGELILKNDTTELFGVALKDYTASGTMIPVIVLDATQVWSAEADTTITTAMEGIGYGLNDTAGAQSIDIGDTSNIEVKVLKVDPRDGATTGSGGRMFVNFVHNALEHYRD